MHIDRVASIAVSRRPGERQFGPIARAVAASRPLSSRDGGLVPDSMPGGCAFSANVALPALVRRLSYKRGVFVPNTLSRGRPGGASTAVAAVRLPPARGSGRRLGLFGVCSGHPGLRVPLGFCQCSDHLGQVPDVLREDLRLRWLLWRSAALPALGSAVARGTRSDRVLGLLDIVTVLGVHEMVMVVNWE